MNVVGYITTQPVEIQEDCIIISEDKWVEVQPTTATLTLKARLQDIIDGLFAYTPTEKPQRPPCPTYICKLHPRKDTYQRPYWLRTRSNPKRRSAHP